MRIVFLIPSGRLGGAELSLLDMISSLRAHRPDWPLSLIAAGDGPLVAHAAAMGVDAAMLAFPRALSRLGDAGAGGNAGAQIGGALLASRLLLAAPQVAGYGGKLRQALRHLRPDLVHTHGFKMHVLGARTAPASVPVVWHMHDYASTRPFMSWLLKSQAHRCAAAIAVSTSVGADFRTLCGGSPPVHVVYNRIDVERFSPEGASLDLDRLSALAPAAEGTVRIGLLATFARWKGHDVFLRAMSRLLSQPDVRGYIIGGPLYESEGSQYSVDELRRLAHDLGVQDRVGFTGYVSDAAAAIRALDLVVHASTQPEPFGRTIVEAMACGKAVVVGGTGGARELIEHGVDAVLVEPNDPEDLARQILRLAANPAARQELGRRGRQTALARFDRKGLAFDLIPIYDSLTAGTGTDT